MSNPFRYMHGYLDDNEQFVYGGGSVEICEKCGTDFMQYHPRDRRCHDCQTESKERGDE